MNDKLNELRKDITELENFEKLSTRQRCKDILSIEIRRLISEIIKLEGEIRNAEKMEVEGTTVTSGQQSNKKYEVKLNNYSWGQSDKFVTFYVTLKNVHKTSKENIKCEFKPRSLELKVVDLDDKDYVLIINNLLNSIKPEKSNWKIKTDMVVVNVAKEKAQNWSHVTEIEKKASEQRAPKMDTENTDPSESLMSLMKNMYETGDDEMKRTIAKAWTESQQKKSSLDL